MARIIKACAILLLVLAVIQLQYQGKTWHSAPCGQLTRSCPAHVMHMGCTQALTHDLRYARDTHIVRVYIQPARNVVSKPFQLPGADATDCAPAAHMAAPSPLPAMFAIMQFLMNVLYVLLGIVQVLLQLGFCCRRWIQRSPRR